MLTLDRLEEIKVVDSNGNELAIDASGYITANINGDVNVTATDLDIRDLTSASDSVAAVQSGTWTIDSITNDVNIADGGNSITVDAVDFDIRDLSHSQDSIKIGDGTDFLAVNADGSLNVQGTFTAEDDAYDTLKATNQSITTTASQIAATALSGRKNIIVQNLGSSDIYVGESSGVTSSTGLLISKKSNLELKASALASLYALTSAGTADIRIMEMAG